MRAKRPVANNRIWVFAVAVLLAFTALKGTGDLFLSALALEQQVRCNIMEHVHTEECYVEDILICREKAHTHSENCYLLLLEDNDINMLLSQVDASEGKSLEKILASVVDKAITYDGRGTTSDAWGSGRESLSSTAGASAAAELWAQYSAAGAFVSSSGSEGGWTFFSSGGNGGSVSTLVYAASMNGDVVEADISELNTNITQGGIQPQVTLNESLTTLALTPEDTAPIVVENNPATQLAASGGVSTLAVGDKASDGTGYINFYIRLDGTVTCIGTDMLSTENNNSSRYVYSIANTVSMYNQQSFVTEVNENNINDTYYIRYNTNGSLTNFETRADKNGNNFRFGRTYTSGARYTILTEWVQTGDYSWQGEYVPVDFYTVTLQDPDGKTLQTLYVQSGQSITLPDTYDQWEKTTVSPATLHDGGASVQITGTTVFKAKPSVYTVTYQNGQTVETVPDIQPGTSITLKELDGDYLWADEETGEGYAGGSSFTVNADTTFVAVPRYYTITYYDEDGKTVVKTLQTEYGTDYTLDETLLPEGCSAWVDMDTGESTSSVTVTRDYAFKAVSQYTVTYIYKNGTTASSNVDPGTTVTLPAAADGYRWMDGQGNTYAGGANVTITSHTTFTESPYLTVRYDVNFPTSGTDYSDTIYWSTAEKPTVAGTSLTTYEEQVVQGNTALIRGVSDREVIVDTDHGGTENGKEVGRFDYPVYLEYWSVAGVDDAKIYPGANLTYEELAVYDTDHDGTVELEGVWSHGRLHAVNFCIAYDDDNVSGEKVDYTPSLFTTFMGGDSIDTSYKRTYDANTTDEQAYLNDQDIRGLYGDTSKGMWMYDFPKDADIFEKLKNYVGTLVVDGEAVQAKDLRPEAYSIRWSVIFYDPSGDSDGWHVDGRLVKKKGNIKVTKTFGGDEAFIEKGQDGFYIEAKNGSKNADGSFTAATGTGARTETMRLTDTDVTVSGNTYTWVIEDVDLDEYWQITEHLPGVDADGDGKADYACYAEYTVYDSDGTTSQTSQYGTTASVLGKTYALDEDPDQGLRVEFKNYYYPSASILIKKEDADTGMPIGGATFALFQNGAQLRFTQSGTQYIQSPGGSEPEIKTADDGFSNISASGISFSDASPLTVTETGAPGGYALTPSISIGESGIIAIQGVDKADWDKYAEYNDNAGTGGAGVLVVKDHSYTTSLTATKQWLCAENERAESVIFSLQANGENANNIFPQLADSEVALSGDSGWSHTWSGLPAYANGKLVTWSVKEIKIGDETAMTGAEGFANWIVTYGTPVPADENGDGTPEKWSVTVSNTLRRPLLVVQKTNESGTAALSGAQFTLQQVEEKDGAWSAVSGAPLYTQTTGADGLVTFDNLTPNAYYLLRETVPPTGYLALAEEVVVRVDNAGTVTFESGSSWVEQVSPYHIGVRDRSIQPLPETGGRGREVYTRGGALVMLAAWALLVYKKRHRREVDLPDG